EKSLADDLRKITDYIGERNPSSAAAARGLDQVSAMIEGSLGPSNTGFSVQRTIGPLRWPILHCSLPGSQPSSPAIWVVASYDSPRGAVGIEANASGLAATIAAAQAVAGDTPARPLHFVFIPHDNDPESPVEDTTAILHRLIVSRGPTHLVVSVDAMGARSEIQLSAPDPSHIPLKEAAGLAEITDKLDDPNARLLVTRLAAKNLPAVRISTRPPTAPDEAAPPIPNPTNMAAASGRLVELIRRCASAP
ncbi:MAG: hypothetical protein ACO3RV_08730, partial [Luteolibacter sp.]